MVVPRHGVAWAREGDEGAAAERQLPDAAHQATSKLVSEPSSVPGCRVPACLATIIIYITGVMVVV